MLRIFSNRVAKNASYIIFSKLIQSVLGLVVSMITARYLGPSNYGLINYATSLVNFVSPIVFLGFNNTLVHELTLYPEKEGEIIGTSIGLSLMSSFFCIFGIFSFVSVVNVGESDTIIVCMLYSLILIFQVLDLINYWFQSKLLSKYSSAAALIAYIVVSLYKIFLLITKKSIYWFAVANTIDFLLISVSLLIIYFKIGGSKLSFSFKRGKQMFSKSRYYIVTGLMIAVFAQTDKIMLKLMVDETATGYYSAAVSCASIISFVYSAIIDSFRPVIFKSHTESQEKFEKSIVNLYSLIIYISLIQSLFMTIFSKLIISILYGSAYAQSTMVLRIVTWYITFSFLGSVRNIWILSENKQKYLWVINLSGALGNVLLNALLIPVIDIKGAAIASVITQFFTNFVIGFIIKPIRENNKLILKALNPKCIISIIKKLKGGN